MMDVHRLIYSFLKSKSYILVFLSFYDTFCKLLIAHLYPLVLEGVIHPFL
jgi:hypothetical protein